MKIIKTIRRKFTIYLERKKRLNRNQDYKARKESIDYLLTKDLKTLESLKLYKEITEEFNSRMKVRLQEARVDVLALEKFCS